MLNKEKLEQLMAILGDLTEEQKAIVTEVLNGPIDEKAFFEKLGVDEGKFTEFMQALAAQTEDAVLGQELSADEMEAASGGISIGNKNCSSYHKRDIYGGKGFPNCAAGVEDGSWCLDNDACTKYMVCYWHMKECGKAWK